ERHGLALSLQDELVAAADDAVLGEHQDVRVQVQDLVPDVAVQATDDRDHGNHGRDSDDDAQKRQEGPELVAAQGLQRDREELSKRHLSSPIRRSLSPSPPSRDPPPSTS